MLLNKSWGYLRPIQVVQAVHSSQHRLILQLLTLEWKISDSNCRLRRHLFGSYIFAVVFCKGIRSGPLGFARTVVNGKGVVRAIRARFGVSKFLVKYRRTLSAFAPFGREKSIFCCRRYSRGLELRKLRLLAQKVGLEGKRDPLRLFSLSVEVVMSMDEPKPAFAVEVFCHL